MPAGSAAGGIGADRASLRYTSLMLSCLIEHRGLSKLLDGAACPETGRLFFVGIGGFFLDDIVGEGVI